MLSPLSSSEGFHVPRQVANTRTDAPIERDNETSMVDGRASEGEGDELDAKMRRDPRLFASEPSRTTRTFGYDWASGFVSPFLASTSMDAETIVRRLKLSERDHVLDLGSGDGTLLLHVVGATGASGTGVELDEELVHVARKKQQAMAVDRVRFVCQDLMEFSVNDATVVLLFLLPQALAKLGGKMKRFLREGRDWSPKIVTNKWPLPESQGYLLEEICEGGVHMYIYSQKHTNNKK